MSNSMKNIQNYFASRTLIKIDVIAFMDSTEHLNITHALLINVCYAPVTRPYICQRTPTYGDTSAKLGARSI